MEIEIGWWWEDGRAWELTSLGSLRDLLAEPMTGTQHPGGPCADRSHSPRLQGRWTCPDCPPTEATS